MIRIVLVVVGTALLLMGCGGKKSAKDYGNNEGISGIRSIYEGARMYYLDTGPAGSAMKVPPPQFPDSSAMTPPEGSCCPNKCAPTQEAWSTDSWRALDFDMSRPHYYSYEFTSQGAGPSSTFVVKAVGDLDCDGEYSTFAVAGALNSDGTIPSFDIDKVTVTNGDE